jgi:hypothetical protein
MIFGIGAGTLMAVTSALVPWLRRATFSPTSGLAIETHDPQAIFAAELLEETTATGQIPGSVPPNVDDDELVGAARVLAADAAVTSLLSAHGPLADCEWHLYLYDSDADRLLPIFEPEDPDSSEGWMIGQGATGMAYLRREFVLVQGAEASDSTYGLSPEQQARYADLYAVAAMPIQNNAGDVIAVVSAATRNASTELTTEAGFQDLVARALGIGRVLIDLLRWFDDGVE